MYLNRLFLLLTHAQTDTHGHARSQINNKHFSPDVNICAHSTVSLHLVGMSSEQEVFSVHMNGQVLQHRGHKMSTVGLVSGSATTGSMRAVHPGRWLLSSQTNKHMEGMFTQTTFIQWLWSWTFTHVKYIF